MWKTFGHDAVKRIIEKQLASGQLPHAYFFSGPEGVGKKMLALEFAGKILDAVSLQNHPDFIFMDARQEDSVGQMRGFITRLQFKPFADKYKVAVIDGAHLLNAQSGNALLKTLEEPGDRTVIILVASPAGLLPTIVSRCQKFSFNLFSKKMMEEFARRGGINTGGKIMELSFGAPGRLLSLASDNNFARQESDEMSKYENLLKTGKAERILAIAGLAEKEPDELWQILHTWSMAAKQNLKQQPRAYQLLQKLTVAQQELRTNKNKKMILQGLFLGM